MVEFVGFMDAALEEARGAAAAGEVPVGAVVTRDGVVVARGRNSMRADLDPSAHAEVNAIRAACRVLGTDRLVECDLWVSLEPCPACAAVISAARIRRLYYAASDPKSGGIAQGPRIFAHPQAHHVPEIYSGIEEDAARALLQEFFAARRR